MISHQRQLLVLLANDICDMFKVRHINDEVDNAFNDLPIVDYVRRDNSFMLLATLRAPRQFIHATGDTARVRR